MGYIFKDIHSHVLPCIDDGAESMKSSLEILKKMKKSGTKDLFLTPHYCQRRGFRPDKERILSVFESLKKACEKEGIDINFHTGCEIEYSADVPELLKADKLLTLANSKYVLIEFAPYTNSRDMIDAVNTIVQLGLIPIIAHIERYPAIRGNTEDLLYLKKIGAKIQVNLENLAKKPLFADRFLKSIISLEIIDFVAGDVHFNSYTSSDIKKCAVLAQKYASNEYAENILFKNAEKILSY